MSKLSEPGGRKGPSPSVLALGAVGLAALIGVGAWFGFRADPIESKLAESAQADDCGGRAFAEIGGPFSLIDQTGKPFTDKDLVGRPALIYFGFTTCPDVCPMSLQTMKLGIEQAGPGAERIQPVLISVDPARDTPESLAAYVATPVFPKGTIGLTGTEEQVSAAAKAYKVFYRAIEPEKDPDGYMVDHTSIIYLLDSKGKLATFFQSEVAPETMGQCLKSLLAKGL